MLPKSLSNINMEPRELPSPAGSADGTRVREQDRSMEATTSSRTLHCSSQPLLQLTIPSAIVITDDSPKGADDGLTPLERARRRNNTIKNIFSRA